MFFHEGSALEALYDTCFPDACVADQDDFEQVVEGFF
jgi:hypothetical protein